MYVNMSSKSPYYDVIFNKKKKTLFSLKFNNLINKKCTILYYTLIEKNLIDK